MQVLQVQAERREAEPGLVGPLGALVRHGRADGQVAALQVGPGQVERGPELDAEDLASRACSYASVNSLMASALLAFAVASRPRVTRASASTQAHPAARAATRARCGPFPGRGLVVLDAAACSRRWPWPGRTARSADPRE